MRSDRIGPSNSASALRCSVLAVTKRVVSFAGNQVADGTADGIRMSWR
jgi:hypothetical protein